MIATIAVIGAGTAGRSFALACVNAGFHVILEDVMPANLRRAQDEYSSLNALSVPSRSAGWEKNRGSLSTALTVEDAARTADIAIDFVPDELESKLEIFSMLDRMAPPRTILLTPSDAQSITDLASCTYPARSLLRAAQLRHPRRSNSRLTRPPRPSTARRLRRPRRHPSLPPLPRLRRHHLPRPHRPHAAQEPTGCLNFSFPLTP